MSISKDPRPGPRKNGHHHWDYLGCENGKSEVGYKAGPTCGVYVHDGRPSKPCRKEMTNGEITCPYCLTEDEPRWKGYVPIYDRDYQRRFCIISQGVRESVAEIPLHGQVRISRAKSSKASIIIRAEIWTPKALPLGDGRSAAADIEPVLFTIWNDAVLRDWYALHWNDPPRAHTSDNAVSLPASDAADRPAPAEIERQKLSREIAARGLLPATLGEQISETLRDAGDRELKAGANRLKGVFNTPQPASKNGTHAKPPKKG